VALNAQATVSPQFSLAAEQPQGIDQIMLEERLNEICASKNVQIRLFLLLIVVIVSAISPFKNIKTRRAGGFVSGAVVQSALDRTP
jgi:hypothetical protein